MTGTDGWSWDPPTRYVADKVRETGDVSRIWEGHEVGREIGYCHLEKLHNLEALPATGFTIACFPQKVRGGSAGATRAVAILEGSAMAFPDIHRVVTGHDEDGRAVIVSEGPLPVVKELDAIPGTVFHEVWNTPGAPVIDNGADPAADPIVLPRPFGGTRIRFVDIPPDNEDFLAEGAARMAAAFSEIGDAAASTVEAASPHPLMHRTEGIDYGIVIEGELTLVLDRGEAVLKPGSVVIQRGTNHAWANRSGRPCRMLFVRVDASYAPGIAAGRAGR